MKLITFKQLLWFMLISLLASFLAWFGAVSPVLADGGGWPTATLTSTPIRLVTATSPFGGAVTPVIAITPLGKDQPLPAGDQALQPTMFSGAAQETTTTSGPNMMMIVLGLVIAAAFLIILLFSFLRRNQ